MTLFPHWSEWHLFQFDCEEFTALNLHSERGNEWWVVCDNQLVNSVLKNFALSNVDFVFRELECGTDTRVFDDECEWRVLTTLYLNESVHQIVIQSRKCIQFSFTSCVDSACSLLDQTLHRVKQHHLSGRTHTLHWSLSCFREWQRQLLLWEWKLLGRWMLKELELLQAIGWTLGFRAFNSTNNLESRLRETRV